jgi:hypothetical protein
MTESLDPSQPLPEDTILFHVIPMTSLASGGANSFDEVFTTTSSKFFTNLLAAVESYPGRRFTLSDLNHLERWYSQQAQSVKLRVKGLIKYGMLEVVGGQWSQSAQACATWQEIVSSAVIAQRFAQEGLGVSLRHAYSQEVYSGYAES